MFPVGHLFCFCAVVISTLLLSCQAQDAPESSSWPALVAHRSPGSKFYDSLTMKLWLSFILRENLVELFDNIHNTTSNDPNIDQASEYLYEAFKYGRIDTYPLIRALRCMLNKDQPDQLETALGILANSSPKYIRCAIEVVQDAVKADMLVIPDEKWDITNDVRGYGSNLIKAIAEPVYKPVRLNSTQAVLQSLWSNISAGYSPPQRLVGLVLLNTPTSVPALNDQIYLGSFLYLEKIPPWYWHNLTIAVQPSQQSSIMEYLKTILEELPYHLPDDIDFEISPTDNVVEIPKDVHAFQKMTSNLARNIVVYKPINSGRRSMGKRKRTLDSRANLQTVGGRSISNGLQVDELRRHLQRAIESGEKYGAQSTKYVDSDFKGETRNSTERTTTSSQNYEVTMNEFGLTTAGPM